MSKQFQPHVLEHPTSICYLGGWTIAMLKRLDKYTLKANCRLGEAQYSKELCAKTSGCGRVT